MAFQFKIQLKDISNPPVWRKVLVPEDFTFDRFHKVIQTAFGWYNYHFYQFSPTGWGSKPIIAIPGDDDWEAPDMNAAKTKLKQLFTKEKQTFVYIYDFGDNWQHKITLEKITDNKFLKKASCMEGKEACPPEDCGGVWGYENFLKVIADPTNPEYQEMRAWAELEEGKTWDDIAGFDLEAINELVQTV